MRYNPQRLEKKWPKRWLAQRTYEPDFQNPRKPFYNLMMFPYPSAEGLHIGGMRTFTGVDIYGRFKRMQGYDVFEPIGLDAFGIHSENYALKTGRHPMTQAKILEKNFYRQLARMGNGFAWEERLETNDPEYYRWTQWIFIQMFKQGLAYRKKQAVNWCPSCKTVLADEQVIAGKCERCSSEVVQKELEQWFFRITNYAERLLKNLETLDWSSRIKIAQRNWIGKSQGTEIEFRIKNKELRINVFTTRADTIFGATYLVLAPEHELLKNEELGIMNYEEIQKYISSALKKTALQRQAEQKEKTGVELKGVTAINPATQKEIPIWVADYVLSRYGTGAIMAVPAHDERDFIFAKKFDLPIIKVIEPKPLAEFIRNPTDTAMGTPSDIRIETECFTGEGELINSEQFNALSSQKAREEIVSWLEQKGMAKAQTQYKIRDWLISRQRYWGPPIPMIFCQYCAKAGQGEREEMPGWYAVPEHDLPVKLPRIKNFRPTGNDKSPLASVSSFYKVLCPHCKKMARRETDVSDTFLDSAWYFLRYPNAKNNLAAWDSEITKTWLPVHSYIGGAEHSVLHLLYSRFLTMAFFDASILDFEEPFTTFRAHGLIIKDGAKMSKSKGNVTSPDEYIKKWGADVMRMYLAFLAPFEQDGDFRDEGIRGIARFLERVYRLTVKSKFQNPMNQSLLHKTIKKVGEDLEELKFNTAISALMVLVNEMQTSGAAKKDYETLVKLLAPFAPHLSEELWAKRGHKTSVHNESFPSFDETLTKDESVTIIVQVNGKVRAKIETARDEKEDEIRAVAEKQLKTWLADKKIKKTIFVKNRLINFVV